MSKRLLPLIPPGLTVVQVLPAPDSVTIVAQPQSPTAACPDCGTPSHSVHSRYERRLGDLPWQGRTVALSVQARRFRCHAPACSRKTFAERLSCVAAAAARRTERLGSLHGCLGTALGGEAGARLAVRLAMGTSPDTLLRAVRALGTGGRAPPAPRVLGVDDWAWRRGHRYGTALVDLERNTMVDLLPDRQAETLATWLRRHPGVEVIARDRAGAYADGARQGAPEAVQVADRWHLLRNLGDAVHALADQHGSAVRRAVQAMAEEHAAATAAEPVPPAAPRRPNAAERASAASLSRRQARYEEAARLHGQGVSIRRIAALLGAERKTVRGWLRRGGAPSWRKPKRGSALAPFVSRLEQRWAEGCHNAARLWREIAAAGYAGRSGTVRAWAARRRGERSMLEARQGSSSAPPSGRRVGRLLMAKEGKLTEDESRFVARLLAGFAANLGRDRDAVQAALDLPWTTSPVEGQVNRIKTTKRSMYGRAGFDLLRARVLQAA